MKAIVYEKYGTPDELHLDEVAKPFPKDNEVLVKVHAASINSWDWDLLTGALFSRFDAIRKPKYRILGADIAGEVEAVGRDVKKFNPGDAVYGDLCECGWSGFAEYVSVPEDALAIKSPQMTFEDAAAIPQAGMLALQSFYGTENMAGQKVLMNGAGGGVGTIGIQLAKYYGAEVTAVDSAGKLDMLRSIGADHVMDYKQEDYTKTGENYDLIIDVVANRSFSAYKRILTPQGRFVMIGGKHSTLLQTGVMGFFVSKTGDQQLGLLLYRPKHEDLIALNELFEARAFVPVIDRVYPLAETPEAFRYFGTAQHKGKLVITMD